MYMSVKQAAEKWGISDRRVRTLCAEGKVPGVIREGRSYRIPAGAKKPEDGRYKSSENLLEKIDRKRAELDTRRPLTEGEIERLTEEFAVEYTYNSNAIEGNTLTLRETDMVLRGLTIDKKPLKDHMDAFGQLYEEWFIGDYDCEISYLVECLGGYENLNELNYLAAKIEDLDECEFTMLESVLEYDGGGGIRGIADVINAIENLDCYQLYDGAYNERDLGLYLLEESGLYNLDELGNLRNYIDYEAFGRDYNFETEGDFVNGGYLEVIDSTTTAYDGPDDIPDEYIILGNNENDEEE